MTGFGRAQAALPDGTQLSITLRSVNHRFLDLS
ncbi:MAG: YicC/YloC family endoribonuclease, partial [Thermoanaerobaculia bacterium]|nr:YicC/YloC family endoribonuclease [Thermoanaerobaculia bacterium]